MPTYSRYIQFTKATGVETQTVTGVGFTGKILFLFSTFQNSLGLTLGSEVLIGLTDGTRQSCRYIRHPGAETSTTSAQSEQTDYLFWRTDTTSPDAVPLVSGQFLEFTTDGFTIDWTLNDGNPSILHAFVLGGPELQAKMTQPKLDSNPKVVTGVGFQPTGFIAIGGAVDEFGGGLTEYSLGAPFGSIHGFGFSDGTSNLCGWTLGRGTGGAADNYRGQHTDRFTSIRTANLAGAGELATCSVTATGADGYTLSKGGTTEPVQHIMCIRGVTVACGSFNTPASPGTVTLTLGDRPGALLMQTLGGALSGNTSNMGLAIGVWGPDVVPGGFWIGGVDGSSPSEYRRASYSGSALQSRTSAGVIDLNGDVSSTTETEIVLTFDTVPATPNSVIWFALATVPVGCTSGGQAPDTTPVVNSESWLL